MSDLYKTGRKPSTTRATVVHVGSEPLTTSSQVSVDGIHSMLRCAEAGDVRPLFAFYRDIVLSDSHIQGEFNKRKLAVLGDRFRIAPANKTNPQDVAAADFIRAQLEDHPNWIAACTHLLDATLYPVALVEKVFRLEGSRYVLDQLVPVPHHLLDYRTGHLRLCKVDAETGRLTMDYFEPDPVTYMIHRGHLLTAPDNFGGPFRSLVFWYLLSALGKDWWTRFLDKYGSPFMVGKYPEANDESRTILESAFGWASRIGGLVISSDTDVEIKQAAASDSGEAYKTFLEVANREKSKLILGQTLSADAQATGMGSGVATQQGAVRDDIRQWDAISTANCVRVQLVQQILDANGLPGKVTVAWGTVSTAELTAQAALLSSLKSAGLEPDDDALPGLSDLYGMTLRRAAAPTFGPPALFSADTPEGLDQLNAAATAGLARGIRDRYAGLKRALRDSPSPDAFLDKARALLESPKSSIQGLAPALTTAAVAALTGN